MLYLDTSFVAVLILPEKESRRVESFVRKLPAGSLAASHWTRVELAGLLARLMRMGELTEDQALRAWGMSESLLKESFHIIAPTAADFDLAARFLQNHQTGLRAGDALHLAIASNNRAKMLLTLDKQLIKAAAAHRIPASAGT
jgi:predicted nucleic acid-binding protein